MKHFLAVLIIIILSYSAFSQNTEISKTIEYHSNNSGILIYSPEKYFSNIELNKLPYKTQSIMANSDLAYQDMDKLLLPTSNFITVYNSSMNNYTYYNYPQKSYFDNNRVKTMAYRPFINKDSLNPYGVSDVRFALAVGLINYLLSL